MKLRIVGAEAGGCWVDRFCVFGWRRVAFFHTLAEARRAAVLMRQHGHPRFIEAA